ncbi:MAG TPA: sigma-70 family RNA polymerase sigma factor [Caulobacteraceae bacterium]|nr:sigma-70 family RNA polymerase sigma factor [Caulobacteraceae bacterium]
MTDTETVLKALMLRGLAGDAKAHGELLATLARHLRAFFARRLGGAQVDVEDLVQETLLAIHLKRDTYDTAQPFTPWAYAIGRYKLLDHFRRQGVRRAVPLEDAGELIAAETTEEGAVRRDLDRLLSDLPERQRALVQDVKLTGHSIEEAAGRQGMTPGAAKVAIHRSLQRLARKVRQ